VPKRKPPTPFFDDDFVYFELQSPNFQAFDHDNDGASYSVSAGKFQPGVYRLPIDAICPATARDEKERPDEIVAVDTCQIFIVDSAFVAKFRERCDIKEGSWPNYPYFEKLRKEIGVDFGHASVASDGIYVLNSGSLTRIEPGEKPRPNKARLTEDLYEKVARRMKTFVCEQCFEEELMGDEETYQQLTQRARDQGWLLIRPERKRDNWFFEEFQVVGPKCAAKRGKAD
jgi:hypothetical protein